MYDFLWLIVALPFVGFLILATVGSRLPRNIAGSIGVGSIGFSGLLAILIGIEFYSSLSEGVAFNRHLWTWMEVGSFAPSIAFRLDALSLIMLLVITVVGFFIHLYSSAFMEDDEGFSRFFAYMNLFVGSMLVLVLADDLLLLLLGWEGVGLCSYLLIGFWYTDPANGYAARKAFVVTRVGDTAMLVGLFLLFQEFGTLNIQTILTQAPTVWMLGGVMPIVVAALLLGGAVGKSAQLPLQTWLPDAMAGPTPTSALIHAATMVTAGVYLIARTHVIFDMAPIVQMWVAIVGAATLLIAGFTALTQRDIKRVLAYSTISQIGYMFLALGVGAYSAAMFHFMTHAFFKALLFLGAGVVIICLHHEHDMFKMGGLRKLLPVTFWTFLIGGASLAAVPLVTAGFYSKDLILWYAWSSDAGSPVLWLAGLVGAFITAIYTFRMIFVTFYGKPQIQPDHKPGMRLKLPLIVLAVLAVMGGFVELPHTLGHFVPFSSAMHTILPEAPVGHVNITTELLFQLIAAAVTLIGIYIAYLAYLKKPVIGKSFAQAGFRRTAHTFWYSGWGFDWLYDKLIVGPYVWIAAVNRRDVVDGIYWAIAELNRSLYTMLSITQSGKVRYYAAGIAFGTVIIIGIVILS